MRFSNNLRHIKVVLYKLNRLFGIPITIRDAGNPSIDLETGLETKDINEYSITRAIVLQGKEIRDFVYDLSYIAANKNFTYGGFFDITTRVIILEARLLPDINITLDYTINIDDVHYEVKNIDKIKGNLGYLIVIKSLASTPQVS